MPTLDIESLLAPVSPDKPCGDNLEYAGLNALEVEVQGTPERQVGNTIVPAAEPDWKGVVKKALDLASRTRDLRVAAILARALLHTQGVLGLSEAITLIAGLVDRHWDHVHPALDPDDGNDPIQRVNVLIGLCDLGILAPLRATPIVNSRAVGRFSLKDIVLAYGEEVPPEGVTPVPRANIDAAFGQAELSEIEAIRDAVGKADALLTLTQDLVGERSGRPTEAPDFGPLSTILRKIHKVVSAQIEARQATAAGTAADAGQAGDGAGEAAAGSAGSSTGVAYGVAAVRPSISLGGGGSISSNQDVLRLLDAICAYYDQAEPSSPVAMVLRRTRQLVGLSFIDIVKEIMPDALSSLTPYRPKDEAS